MTERASTEIADPVLGLLRWNAADTMWVGTVSFHGRQVALSIDTGIADPSSAQRLGAVEQARPQLPMLLAAEEELRSEAFALVEEQMASQGPFPIEEFRASTYLQGIALHGSGELYYDCSRLFGNGAVMTVFFEPDLRFGDMEIEQP